MSSVSVITCVFNESFDLFKECAQSISNQEIEFEWLVIDDGSSQEYAIKYIDIIANVSSKVKVIYIALKNNSGLSIARNYGIDLANGEWIVVLDSDDHLAKNAIKKIEEVDSRYSLVCFDSLYFNNTMKEYRSISKFHNLYELFGKSILCPFL